MWGRPAVGRLGVGNPDRSNHAKLPTPSVALLNGFQARLCGYNGVTSHAKTFHVEQWSTGLVVWLSNT